MNLCSRCFWALLALVFIMLPLAACDTPVDSIPEPTESGSLASSTIAPSPTPLAPTATIKPTPTPTEKPTPTPEPIVDPNPDLPYYLYFEKGSFTLTVYGKDENFEYTEVLYQFRCAHGGNKTPAGIFELGAEIERWHAFPKGGTVQFAVPYHGNLYLHSPLYGSADPYTMWPKYYSGEKGIGKISTGGCIRMVTAASRWIYENCPPGTILEIVNGSPRGTTSEDIPPMETYGIDPTDIEVNGENTP